MADQQAVNDEKKEELKKALAEVIKEFNVNIVERQPSTVDVHIGAIKEGLNSLTETVKDGLRETRATLKEQAVSLKSLEDGQEKISQRVSTLETTDQMRKEWQNKAADTRRFIITTSIIAFTALIALLAYLASLHHDPKMGQKQEASHGKLDFGYHLSYAHFQHNEGSGRFRRQDSRFS